MIDEDVLSGLLTEHALRIPVPDSAIVELLAEAPRVERPSITERVARTPPPMLAAAAVIAVVIAMVFGLAHLGGGSGGSAKASGGLDQTSTKAAPSARSLAGAGAAPARPAEQQSFAAAPHQPASPAGGTNASPPTSAAPTATKPGDTARVVRTGSIDLRIARHSFGTTVGRITTITAAEGGFIAEAQTNESAATPSGTMTIRVPSARFNATVGRLRALGKVISATTRGTDVTGQYTDLQARLHAATATRDQYLTVLTQAKTIGDILSVQDRIQSVQTEIDQLQGQINDLNNQTTYGTITIALAEPGPRAKVVVPPKPKGGLSLAWDNARNGFARRVEAIISHSGSVLVILISLLLLAIALRFLVPRMRRAFV